MHRALHISCGSRSCQAQIIRLTVPVLTHCIVTAILAYAKAETLQQQDQENLLQDQTEGYLEGKRF